jgi:signal transduction histidine kinase
VVHREEENLTLNALPSIGSLTRARTDLRYLETRFDYYLAMGNPDDSAALRDLMRELDHDISAYLELPTFPGEREQWTEIGRALNGMKQTLWRAVAGRAAQGPLAFRASADPVHAAISQVDEGLHALILFNASQGQAAMLRSAAARRSAERGPLVIDIIGLALAALAAALGVRAIRRFNLFRAAHERQMLLRADELEQFSGRVAHDIRNPLNAISLILDLIRKTPQLDPKVGERIERGRSAMTRVLRIIEGLYQFARAGAQPQEGASADVVALLADAAVDVRPAAEAAEIDLQIETSTRQELAPGHEVQAACSAGVLSSVLTNLLGNAIKYMGDSPVRRVTARVICLPRKVRVEIEDTGPGIPADVQDSIFEPYVRANDRSRFQPGIGLGLATVKRIVTAHGGKVGVRSVLGQGSLFWLELPALPPTERKQ